jgi:hypothetical protein
MDGCHHFASVRTQLLNIFSSETTWSLETKLWWNGSWVIHFQNCVRQSRPQPTWSLLLKIKKGDEIQKIVISETTGPIGTKLCYCLLSSVTIFVYNRSAISVNRRDVSQGDSGEEIALWLLTSLCTSAKREVEVAL